MTGRIYGSSLGDVKDGDARPGHIGAGVELDARRVYVSQH
jgi:hypothetical protein